MYNIQSMNTKRLNRNPRWSIKIGKNNLQRFCHNIIKKDGWYISDLFVIARRKIETLVFRDRNDSFVCKFLSHGATCMIYTWFAHATWITRFDRVVIMRKFRSGLKIEHYPKCIAVLPRLSGAHRVALKFISRKHTIPRSKKREYYFWHEESSCEPSHFFRERY